MQKKNRRNCKECKNAIFINGNFFFSSFIYIYKKKKEM